MAFHFPFQIFAILFIAISQPIFAEVVDYPVGVSLGQYHLSSAYYNAQNKLINVVTINSSKEWQDYYWATWTDKKKHTPSYDPDTVAMFSRTLEEIQSATEIELGRHVEYRAVTAPAHFIMKSSIASLMRAAYDLKYFASGQSYQVINLLNAARLAYDLDDCATLGLPAGCIPEEFDNFALVLEYSEHYLTVNFLIIGLYLCNPVHSRRFPNNGEEANRGHLADPNGDTFLELARSIHDFMDEMIAYLIENNIEDPESKIYGIVLSGEASMEGMEEMKQVIEAALPDYKDHFLFSIDPGLLGAIGAAHRARQYVTENAIMNPPEPHEEL